jgi:hypothetical protein
MRAIFQFFDKKNREEKRVKKTKMPVLKYSKNSFANLKMSDKAILSKSRR